MKDTNRLVRVAIALLLLPVLALKIWYYSPNAYSPGDLPVINDSDIIDTLPKYHTYDDTPAEGAGAIIFDLSHRNNTSINDLTPLRERIAKRGVELIDFDQSTGFDVTALRRATALVIISPTNEYSESERVAIREFAADGGRVLIAADPTRTAELVIEDLFTAFFPESAIPAINSIANDFGIVYVDDYMYNIVNNEGNYRNVILRNFAEENTITDGLRSLVVFAAHTLLGDGTALAIGDKNTFSPVRTGEINLSPMMLSEDGQLLALGDVTFLTPPFNTMADNDHFLSNLADWLATAERERDLYDFPYLFNQPVDLISAAEGTTDPQLIFLVNQLNRALSQTGLSVSMSANGTDGHDAIRVATFENADAVDNYLTVAKVNITDDDDDGFLIKSPALGTFSSAGSTLYITNQSELAVNIIVLAEDDDAIILAIERLIEADFSDCVQSGMVTLCNDGTQSGNSDEEDDTDEQASSPCGYLATSNTIGKDYPRVTNVDEAECILELGQVKTLRQLSENPSLEIPFEAGDLYEYQVNLEESINAYWAWGWCSSPEQFEDNWGEITLTFTLNGVEIPLKDFVVKDTTTSGGDACRRYYTILTDWPGGDHFIITEIFFEVDIDDGASIYPAGTRTYVYIVSVGG